MTPSDFFSILLMAGFSYVELETINTNTTTININGKSTPFVLDLSYKQMWRYSVTRPYDIGVVILADGCVLILYELEVPNQETWEHHYIFNDPKEAWDFIRNFLQEHP